MTKRIYLAGFDVFRADAVQRGDYLKSLCARHGLLGVYPFDNAATPGPSKRDTAAVICRNNMAALRSCDAVLANLNHFRGHEPDSGTVFEVGMAVALGIPVWAYFTAQGSLRDQIDHDEHGFDSQNYEVEDFDLPRNLMLACTWAGASETAEDAVAALARFLGNPAGPPANLNADVTPC